MSANLFSEIWKFRQLMLLFSINDVKLRYKNSVLGFLWTFLEPLLMLSILYFVFTNIIKNNIENYPLFLLVGLVSWYMITRATSMGLASIVEKSSIIQNAPIRKEILVISSSITSLIMTMFEFLAFGAFLIVFQFIPPITIILLPIFLIDLFLISIGISFILSVLYVRFSDIKFIWQVVMQAGFFVSPIFYNIDIFPENIRSFLYLNPMVPILNSIHGVTLYGKFPLIIDVVYLLVFTLAILLIGYMIFKHESKTIVERL